MEGLLAVVVEDCGMKGVLLEPGLSAFIGEIIYFLMSSFGFGLTFSFADEFFMGFSGSFTYSKIKVFRVLEKHYQRTIK